MFAWAGAALFAVSLSYFLFSYAFTFGETVPGPLRWRAVAVDATLFTIFALHHSVFARERVRAWMARVVSPGNERSVYVWVASLMLIAVCALWQPVAGVAWRVGAPLAWPLYLGQLAGIWLSLRSAAIIDVWDLAGVRQATTPNSQLPTPKQGETREGVGGWEFKTEGPYGWVRHPIYAGWFLLVFAAPTMTMTRLVFAAISAVYVVAAIPLEERTLRHVSAGSYERYTKEVRWRLLPGVF